MYCSLRVNIQEARYHCDIFSSFDGFSCIMFLKSGITQKMYLNKFVKSLGPNHHFSAKRRQPILPIWGAALKIDTLINGQNGSLES